MYGEQETFFGCPHCGEKISMVLEVHYSNQEYIEDCQVCCSPILISYETDGENVILNKVDQA
ncbi:CPXCG motif-containing cysteine-rich protein [Bacteriovoracaceae bacterium]|nr:CPXCG motif-containing cysteine-rich protein [Bacteriovoracaceae bacterium]